MEPNSYKNLSKVQDNIFANIKGFLNEVTWKAPGNPLKLTTWHNFVLCQQNSCKLRILNHVMGFKFLAHLLEDVALQLLWVFKDRGNIQIIALFKENELLRGYSSISRLLQQCPFPIDLTKNLLNVIGPLRWVGSKKDFSIENNKIVSQEVPVRIRKGCGGQTKMYVNF